MESAGETGLFDDRLDAGRHLAGALQNFAGTGAVILGLARGGVEVGSAAAVELRLPLRALVIRKIGAPHNRELAVGAVSSIGLHWVDERLKKPTGASDTYLEEAISVETAEAKRQQERYGGYDLRERVAGHTAIVVDDGIATGASALVGLQTARVLGANRLVLATPVASVQAAGALAHQADDVIVLLTPEPFRAVGLHYRRFDQLDDEVVLRRLKEAEGSKDDSFSVMGDLSLQNIEIPAGSVTLPGILSIPPAATGIVVFVHGSGSGRFSPRNAAVARMLRASGLATLLPDLLTEAESGDRRKIFDIELLADRLEACLAYVDHYPGIDSLPCGLFGASTGAAAALVAATRPTKRVAALVSRGGRTDLAAEAVDHVRIPTLLLVGSNDAAVLALNRHTFDRLQGEKRLTLIPGAGHLFEEPGALDAAAEAARDWFLAHLTR